MTLEDRAWAIYLQTLRKFNGYSDMDRLAKKCFEVARDFERNADEYRIENPKNPPTRPHDAHVTSPEISR